LILEYFQEQASLLREAKGQIYLTSQRPEGILTYWISSSRRFT